MCEGGAFEVPVCGCLGVVAVALLLAVARRALCLFRTLVWCLARSR